MATKARDASHRVRPAWHKQGLVCDVDCLTDSFFRWPSCGRGSAAGIFSRPTDSEARHSD